jgi:hypothetical protein
MSIKLFRIASAIATMGMLFSCSETGSPMAQDLSVVPSSSSVSDASSSSFESGTPSAPTPSERTLAYQAPLTPAQISSDLSDIAALGSMDALNLGSPSGLDGMMASTGTPNMNTLRKTVAQATCESMDSDTTFTDEFGATISETTRFKDDQGNPFQMCMEYVAGQDFETMMAQLYNSMDGVHYSIFTSSVSTEAKMEMNMIGSMDVTPDANGLVKTVATQMEGSTNVEILQPKAFNMYADIKMSMLMDMSALAADTTGQADASSTITGSMNIHFMDGRYQCNMTISQAETSSSCDLTHNGEIVGTLGEGVDGEMEIKDVDGNIVEPAAL